MKEPHKKYVCFSVYAFIYGLWCCNYITFPSYGSVYSFQESHTLVLVTVTDYNNKPQ